MDFSKFNKAVKIQYGRLSSSGELFVVGADKDELYQLYLSSFPEGSNPIYKERTEHDCTCCKQFIRNTGLVVGFIGGKLESIWDLTVPEPAYQAVANAMAKFVRSKSIVDLFRRDIKKIGNDTTHQHTETGVITWNHFAYELPKQFVMPKDAIPEFLGLKRTNKELLERACKEITLESCEAVLDLISQNSVYRGAEHLNTVKLAVKTIKEFKKIKGDTQEWLWKKSAELGEASRFKNSVIGALLVDLSEGVDLDVAVKSFELKVAPANYKRPTALITQGMITKAQEKIAELGLEAALHRRYAVTEDLTVNNVLFADRSAKKVMAGVFDDLKSQVKDKAPELGKVQEMTIQDFLDHVLPNATGLELMLENKHTANLMSIVAPVDKEAGNILKWSNNFSWTYNGEVADSIKEKVKAAGGSVEGDLCCRLAWEYKDDLDFHMIEPTGYRIYFGNRRQKSRNGGELDVDANGADGLKEHPVENIFYQTNSRMSEGDYWLIVNNYNRRSDGVGFEVEIEFDGATHNFVYDKVIKSGEYVDVATINYSKKNGFTIKKSLPSTTTSKEVWGINTNKWIKVDLLLNSPNHWDDQTTGNKHWFFILEGCKNPDDARGFYNEFLKDSLTEHRKVFEVLGSKLKAPYSENQLSGVGFSSTIANSVLCKVSGTFNRVIKINF